MTLRPFADVLLRGLITLMSLVVAGASGAGVMLLFFCLGGTFGMMIGLLAIPFWLVAAVVVGGPLWMILHASGHGNRRAVRLSGAGAAGLCAPLVLWGFLADSPASTPDPQTFGLLAAAGVAAAISGAVAGNVAWSLAHGDNHA